MKIEVKVCLNPDCKEKNNPTFSKCWKCGALLDYPLDPIAYQNYKPVKTNTLHETVRERPVGGILGLSNLLLGFLIPLVVLVTQFALILFGLLSPLYFIAGIAILNLSSWARKAFLFAVFPISLLAIFNVWAFGNANVPDYFKTPPKAQIAIIGFFILIPILCNLIYLNLPKVKKKFIPKNR